LLLPQRLLSKQSKQQSPKTANRLTRYKASASVNSIEQTAVLASAPEKDVPMATIQIKTPSPDQAIPLVKDALAMETKLTRDSLRTTDERIAMLAGRLDVTPEQVMAGAVPRTEENEALLLDLEGELELRRALQDTLGHLEQLEVCP
jgi:hypothetical protein